MIPRFQMEIFYGSFFLLSIDVVFLLLHLFTMAKFLPNLIHQIRLLNSCGISLDVPDNEHS